MDNSVKMIPVKGLGIIYILDVSDTEIFFKFHYYSNSKISFRRRVDIVEVDEGIILPMISDHVVIPYRKRELIRECGSNETANEYFK